MFVCFGRKKEAEMSRLNRPGTRGILWSGSLSDLYRHAGIQLQHQYRLAFGPQCVRAAFFPILFFFSSPTDLTIATTGAPA